MEIYPTSNRIRRSGYRHIFIFGIVCFTCLAVCAYAYLNPISSQTATPYLIFGSLAAISFFTSLGGYRSVATCNLWEKMVREERLLTCVRCTEGTLTIMRGGGKETFELNKISKVYLSYPILCVRMKGLRLDGKFRMGWYERADLERMIEFIESTKDPTAAPSI